VSRFVYLGATLNQKLDCDEEVKIRIGRDRLKNVILAGSLPVALRLRVVKFYVWPMLLYVSIKVRILNSIEAFEMWTLLRLVSKPSKIDSGVVLVCI